MGFDPGESGVWHSDPETFEDDDGTTKANVDYHFSGTAEVRLGDEVHRCAAQTPGYVFVNLRKEDELWEIDFIDASAVPLLPDACYPTEILDRDPREEAPLEELESLEALANRTVRAGVSAARCGSVPGDFEPEIEEQVRAWGREAASEAGTDDLDLTSSTGWSFDTVDTDPHPYVMDLGRASLRTTFCRRDNCDVNTFGRDIEIVAERRDGEWVVLAVGEELPYRVLAGGSEGGG